LCIARDNLRKIIEELVDNAFKFSKQGTEVHVTALREGEDYLISVTDHGVGMATEQIEQLGAYVQFERALREQQGIGLGFAIANRVVELHDGELMIESILGQGTRVDVRLPIQPKIDSIQIS
jgi:signal transduction histidine kinase